jgi:hypothetical protein
VTLINVSRSQRTEKSTPILRDIPFVNRWFRNVGIGQIHLGDEAVVIPLKDVKRLELVDEEKFRQRFDFPSDGAAKRGRTANRQM